MQLLPVPAQATEKEFLLVNPLINSKDPNYIRPLDKDILEVFDLKNNATFQYGEAARWVLKDDEGKLLGRIAAFTNTKYITKGDEVPVGGIGFFDCINDQSAADLLFDVARHWLHGRGMGAMDGPINFGERDKFWGLVVDGFHAPLYCMNYNPPYYKHLFEHYGFKPFFSQVCFALKVHGPLEPKFAERHARLKADPNYSARHIEKKRLEKYAADFTVVYNKAWAGHGGLKEIKLETVIAMFRKMKAVMDERIVWFVYYKEDPIAVWINLPDINQWFRYLDGKFDLLAKLKFLWYRYTVKCNRITGIVFGVVPRFQGRGVDTYMIVEGASFFRKTAPYIDYEMQWIGDFNPKMINVAENLGAYRSRTLVTYRYNFDPTREVKRHPVL
jgi:hypothetical protein